MNHSIYEITIPVCIKYLDNLLNLITKGEIFLKKKKHKEEFLLEAKLAPDMYNFTKQVGYAYFTALEMATILSEQPMPELPETAYNEKTIKELKKSLIKVIAFLKSVKSKELSEADKLRVKTFLHSKKRFKAIEYVTMLAIPNFFFHVTTSYDILRHLGVSIGKDNYIGV